MIAPMMVASDTHWLTRRPANSFARSIRNPSIQNRPIPYPSTYIPIKRPGPGSWYLSIHNNTATRPSSHSDSYKNVGWKVVPSGNPTERNAVALVTSSAHGRSVGRPKSSWLNQLPHRPMAWASGIAGAAQVAAAAGEMPRRLASHNPTVIPNNRPPGIPRPPFQTATMSPGASLNRLQSVTTW